MSAWHKWGLAVALTALAIAYSIAYRAPAVGAFHDDGVYIVTAKALAEEFQKTLVEVVLDGDVARPLRTVDDGQDHGGQGPRAGLLGH